MPVTAYMYSQFPLGLLKKLLSDLDAGGTDIKCMLCTDSYLVDQETDECFTDVTDEVVGVSYVADGQTLTTKAVSEAAKVTTFGSDNPTWAASTITARYAVLYDNTPAADADKKLIMYIDFGTDYSSTLGEFKITVNVAGWFTFTVP